MSHVSFRRFAIALGILVLAALPLAAQELTSDEASCQQRSSFLMASFGRRYSKCTLKCAKRFGAAAVATQCTESGSCSGGDDNTCRCFERATSSAVNTQSGRCFDCPECYVNSDGDTNPECHSDAEAKVNTSGAFFESLLVTGAPGVFCDDSASLNGNTTAEKKCQLTTAKALATFAKSKAVCMSDCREAERAGTIPAGACDPPILTNPNAPATAKNCVTRWETKSIKQIDGRCESLEGGAKPECWGSKDGADWVAQVESFVDAQDPTFFCGFPSAAFDN